MNDPTRESPDGFKLLARVEALRSDEGGSLTLLAGMMVFLVTIFGILAFDTNMAIYNRIVAQNAVDAAADSAALWEARGCNLLQQLNNLHYTVDTAFCVAEGAAGVACVVSDGLMVAEAAALDSVLFAELAPAISAARTVSCTLCDTLPYLDVYQNIFYNAVLTAQQGVVDLTPYVAFGFANSAAQGSGADSILAVLPQYLGGVASTVSGLIPGLGGIASAVGSIGGAISGFLGSIPIYAVPLDPDDFGLFDPSDKGLYVKQRDNDGNPPLNWPSWVGEAGQVAGYIGCSEESEADAPFVGSPLIGPPFFGYFDQADNFHSDYTKEGPGNETWGWNDSYYFGWPGFSTWIAGKTERDELLGLGNLVWLNGGMKNSDYTQNGEAVSKVMWTGSVTGGGNLKIPAFIAIASSQVQGTPVICHGDANAKGTLIKVYFPGSSPTSGETYFIYH